MPSPEALTLFPSEAPRPKRRPAAPVEDRRTGTPAEQMRADLARFRAVGRDFDSAWTIAFGRIKWPHDTQQRQEWKAILTAGRHHWRSAYLRELPSRPVAAAAAIVAA